MMHNKKYQPTSLNRFARLGHGVITIGRSNFNELWIRLLEAHRAAFRSLSR